MDWIVEPEYIACFLLAIILGNTLRDQSAVTLKTGLFRASLFVSIFTVLVNIFSIYAINYATSLPFYFVLSINTAFFILVPLMAVSIAAAALATLYEDRYEEKRFRVSLVLLLTLAVLYGVLALVNLKTGWLFHFDDKMQYVRGPLNKSGAGYLAVVIGVVLACYFPERRRVRRYFRVLLWTICLSAMALVLLQVIYPNTMFSGTAAALTLTILFIYSQQQQIHVDHLTELYNREHFYETLERLKSRETLFHVVVVSLRSYKKVNNQLGQREGDRLLREVGAFLSGQIRNSTAFRFTGVEFALTVWNVPEWEYEQAFQRITARFTEPWQIGGQEIQLRAVIADIAYPEHVASVNELVDALEYAVRIAKDRDDGKPVRFNKQLKNELGRRNYVISRLEPALREDRFYLNFQPIYDCARGGMVSAEALLRLREADGTLIPPGEFIPLAMETGLAPELDWMVLEKACAFLSTHRDAGIEWLSVNVTVQQYEQADSVEHILALLDRYGVAPGMLKLEITERALIDDMERARDAMTRLAARGVGVCLDDFGTGYSNLYNAMTLPFEYVKVDKSLVDSITHDAPAYALLETVIHGLKSLGARVLVEGVEEQEQDEAVRRLAVDRIQGFYYARPMDEADFLARMAVACEKNAQHFPLPDGSSSEK